MKGLNIQSLVIVFLALVLLILVGIFMPRPTNWEYTFGLDDKNPFGLYVLKQEMKTIFAEGLNETYFSEDTLLVYDNKAGKNVNHEKVSESLCVLFIKLINNWGQSDIEKVLRSVEYGQSAFISSTSFPDLLTDTLGFKVVSKFNTNVNERDSLTLILNSFPQHNLTDNRGLTGSYISHLDSSTSRVLGYSNEIITQVKEPNCIQISFGKGYFFIHTDPVVFTNYHLLKGDSYKYAESLLSYIPKETNMIWGVSKEDVQVISGGPLRYIMSQPALKFAWFLMLSGVFLLLLTTMRRQQRVIPIISPVENSTLKFVSSIGDLYMRKGNIRQLMDRKIVYNLERIRSQYFIATDVLEDDFVNQLTQISGQNREIVKQMVFLMQKHRETDYNCTMDDLRRLHQAIEKFYTYDRQ